MNEFTFELPTLFTASLTLSAAAVGAWIALRSFKPAGHQIYRIVWLTVLINGIMLARVSIDLPVLDPNASKNIAQLFGETSEQPNSRLALEVDTSNRSIDRSQSSNHERQPIRQAKSETVDRALITELETAAVVTGFDLYKFLQAIWAIGFFAAIAYLSVSYARMIWILNRSRFARSDWSRECDQICQLAGLKSSLPLLEHEQLGPALILSPTGYRIVVPEELWSQMNLSQRHSILRHEIEHYRRGDIISSLFGFVVASLHWFNPFAWLALSQLNLAAEWACDDAAVTNERQQSDFARALLTISTSNSKYLAGAHGMSSSDLKARIQRLFHPARRTSPIGNIALSSVILFIVMIGWVNLRLIENSAFALPRPTVQIDEAELEKKVKELLTRLSPSELNKQFAALSKSQAGLIAIGNSIADVEYGMRQEAINDVVPKFFESEVNESFRQKIAEDSNVAQSDIAKLKTAIAQISGELTGQSDTDKIFKRFLQNSNAATVLYFREIREQLRPGRGLLMEFLGKFLAPREDGKLLVRESAKSRLIPQLKKYDDADKYISILKSELNMLGDELIEKDELHQTLKKRLKSANGAEFVLAMGFENREPIGDFIEGYLEQIDDLLIDEPEGLAINEDVREELQEAMQEMESLIQRSEKLRTPLTEIVADIETSVGEEERLVKEFLSSELGLALISLEIDLDVTDTSSFADKIRSEVLQKSADGWIVREDRQEEVHEFSRQMLRASRELRRQLRMVANRTAEIPGNQIGNMLNSPESKLILLERVKQYLDRQQVDVWPDWLDQHFELNGNEYRLREDSRDWIENLTREAKEIEQELANDDF